MNRLHKQIIVAIASMIGFLFLMGIVGSYDYAEQVVYTMPEAAYYSILDTLGDDCSIKAIAKEYMENREYYDSLKY